MELGSSRQAPAARSAPPGAIDPGNRSKRHVHTRRKAMTEQQTIDQARLEAFVGKALGDTSGATVTILAALGDRLGLFKTLAARGPATSAQLAERAGIDERYAREWLGAMASAAYLEYDPTQRCFTLPPEPAPVLAH